MNKTFKVVSVVGLVVGLVALVSAISAHQAPVVDQSQSQLGGVYEVNNAAPQFTAGADFGPLPVNVNWYGGKIGPKSNYAFYKNTTGNVQYVENVETATDGTASSSYKIYAYSTTTSPTAAANIAYDFAAPVQISQQYILTNGFPIATSSLATTTSSHDTRSGGPIAGSVVQIPNNGYYIVRLVSTYGCLGFTATTLCESATSTNRGFNLPWRILVHN